MMKRTNNLNHSSYKRNKVMRDFLLSFFPAEAGYYEKEVNGFFLIKQFTDLIWTVAIYTRDSYFKRKKHSENFSSVFKKRTRGNSESEYK